MKKKWGILGILFVLLVLFTVPVSAAVGCDWEGDESDDWHTTGNWSCGAVPTASDNVTIPVVTGPNFYPVLNTDDATVKNMDVAFGAEFDAQGWVLTVAEVLTNDGTLKETKNVSSSVNGTPFFDTVIYTVSCYL